MGEGPNNRLPEGPRRFDWGRLRQRLEAARAAAVREATPDEELAILRKRAKALARQPLQEEAGAGLDCLEFLLTYETYAIEMRWIIETCPLRELTPLPCTPPFVAGIINVRGRIVSVLDLRQFFDLPQKGLTDLNKVIVVRGAGMEFGILADEILGTRTIPQAEVQPPLPTLTGIREEYLMGITGGRTAILDGARLLADKGIIVHDETDD